jgi:uncharacterized membrane protein (DUF106 family)
MVVEWMGITFLQPTSVLIVAFIAVGVSLFSAFVHRKMVDRKKMDEIREKIEQHQKEYMKAQKEDNQKKLKQLEKKQSMIFDLVKKNMMMSMKPLFFTMPVFLVIIWLMGAQYGEAGPLMDLPFSVPLLTYSVPEINVSNAVSWFGIYLVVALCTGLSVELMLKKVLKK